MEGLGVSFSQRCDFKAVPVRVKRHAFVVPIAGSARSIQDRESVVLEPLRECVDELLGANRDGNVRKPHTLRAWFYGHWRKRCCLHHLDARAIREAEKARFEPLGWVDVSGACDGAKVGPIELLAPFEIGRSPI